MKPDYTIERWRYGWVFCGGSETRGIPSTAFSETKGLFTKGTIIDPGIAHHLRACGKTNAVMCVATKADSEKWRAEITDSIKQLPAQERWWKGLDVGMSSAAIFAVFCEDRFKFEANEARSGAPSGALPRDADDFGRCQRLLVLFPEWRAQLSKVVDAYPETKWREVITRWDVLEKALPEEVTHILGSI